MGMACALLATVVTVLCIVLCVEAHEGFGKDNVGRSKRHHEKRESCEVYKGKWVYDASSSSHVLYNGSSCPFIIPAFNCESNGRTDRLYLHYRWQPTSCNLPRFNGRRLLRKLKGKRVMFVGDSLSLNQWQSLTCMLYSSIPNAHYTLTRIGSLSTFMFQAYNVSIMYDRNALLVDIARQRMGRVLKLNSIENGNKWKENDVLIFNTWHWWLHNGRKQPWDYIRDGNTIHKDMDRLVAYEKALRTWAKWVESNVDTRRTKVFFQGVSPDHTYGKEWGKANGGSCKGEREAVKGKKYPGGYHPAEKVLERVLEGASLWTNNNDKKKKEMRVELLDITGLSQLRKDGHPSVYGEGGRRGNDCTHWCLPGVPDTWNLLLYTALIPK